MKRELGVVGQRKHQIVTEGFLGRYNLRCSMINGKNISQIKWVFLAQQGLV